MSMMRSSSTSSTKSTGGWGTAAELRAELLRLEIEVAAQRDAGAPLGALVTPAACAAAIQNNLARKMQLRIPEER